MIAVQITGPGFLGVAADHDAAATPRAHLMMQVAPRDFADVEARLAEIAGLTALHQISGDFDLLAVVEAARPEDLERTVETIVNLAGVRRAQAAMIAPRRIARPDGAA